MRTFLLILVLLLVGVGAYGYVHNPDGCVKLGDDLKNDLIVIFTPTASSSSTNDTATPAESAPSVAPAGAAIPATPAPPAVWAAPTVVPSQPDWTWTTAEGIYKNVRIVKIEADCVTIIHADGGALVPIAELPADLQKKLNYDPAAATAAAARRRQGDEASQQEMAKERASVAQAAAATQSTGETTDYNSALAQAKTTGKRVLLHFTGSDWCYYCKQLESEVISTPAFSQFARANYIVVTLDFPHDAPISDSLKQQNQALAQKYNVSGFPTLLVIDSNEKELGRMAGYNPGSGPSAVIGQLQSFGAGR